MRICQLMIGEGFGGGERSFVDTAMALADHGHIVQAVCHRNFAKRSTLEHHRDLRVSPVEVRGAWDLGAAWRIRREMARFGPDVVHVHLARGAWLGGRAARSLAVPVVAKLHNYAKLKYYRYVDGFIGTTPDQRRYLLEHGIPENRIAVIPNFSRMPVATGAPPTSANPGPLHFVTCGRLHEVKGFDILLRAMAELRHRGVPARLTIGGSGSERLPLERLCAELQLTDRVEFAGWIEHPERLLDRGNVYVLSSRTESFGISLLEAMARGLPIVSTRCQGPTQLLTEEQAWFAPPDHPAALADAMQAAIENPRRRRHCGGLMRQLATERYSEQRVLPQIVDFYRSCGARPTPDFAGSVWPCDYVRRDVAPSGGLRLTSGSRSAVLDRGQVLVRRDAVEALVARGWETVAHVMESHDVELIRRTNGRDNCRVVLGSGAEVFHGCLKRHWETGLRWPWGQRRSPGQAEALAVAMCQAAGVSTMATLAAGAREFHSPSDGRSVRESFYLSERIDGPSGFELNVAWNCAGRSAEVGVIQQRQRMIAAAAHMIRRMHSAGLYHQDLFWTHLFFRESAEGHCEVRLIDLQRMLRPPAPVRWFYWWKDMEQMRFSMQRMQFTAAERDAWYRHYFHGPFRTEALTWLQRLLTALIRIRGGKRAWKYARRRRTEPVHWPAQATPQKPRRAA